MKTRAVKIYLGGLALRNIRVPRTSYRWVNYRNQNDQLRHRRTEGQLERYVHSSTPRQSQFGIHYQADEVRTRKMNINDIKTLHDPAYAKANPIANNATKIYIRFIQEAIQQAAKYITNRLNRSPSPERRSSDQTS